MSAMEVLICDDNPDIADSLAAKVEGSYPAATATAVRKKAFQELIGKINRERDVWRRGEQIATSFEPTEVDKADVIFIDYDLLLYSDEGDITGSRLAYLLRCFTRCGLIVVLNEYGTNTFDLSLRSPPDGFADLHLGAAQIGNPGLWPGSFEGYRPWHWPILSDAKSNFDKCVEDIRENIEAPVLDFLGLTRVIDWLPERVHEFFRGSGDLETVQFRAFVEHAKGGIASKDDLPPENLARVAAARLLTLLNGLILPEQSVLVDAPHLALRFPSLVLDDNWGIHDWNRLCDPSIDGFDGLLSDVLKDHRFEKPHWLWRPAWYWPDISRDERIAEVKDPWTVAAVDWVFCENVSRFVPVEFADDFKADVSPPFDKRFVLKRESSDVRSFVGKVGSGGPQDPVGVEYIPQAAFSM